MALDSLVSREGKWRQLLATLVNMVAILLGALVGIALKRGIPEKAKNTIMQGLGLAIMVIGLKMAMGANNDIVVIMSLVVGGILGEIWALDDKLANLGASIKKKLKVKDSNFVDGFVSASLIFCVGAMAIVGSIDAGLRGDYTVLYLKSTLDGIVAIVLASSLGVGVACAAFAVLIYQGAITLLAVYLQNILVGDVVSYMTAVGGILIIGIGMGVANLKQINTINLLPGIFVAGIFGYGLFIFG